MNNSEFENLAFSDQKLKIHSFHSKMKQCDYRYTYIIQQYQQIYNYSRAPYVIVVKTQESTTKSS